MPPARGPLSEALIALLLSSPETGWSDLPAVTATGLDVLDDHDLQLSLYLVNELHYTSIDGVDERWEWNPALLAWTGQLERSFEAALVELAGASPADGVPVTGEALQQLVSEDAGPSLSRLLEAKGTRRQMIEHVVHRSAYQLKEADPHSFAIPRLAGPPKGALVEIQFDEYGEGRATRAHAELFAATMAGLGLDPTYGAYLAQLPGITLATVNLMSLFALHRRWRGALVGHLAAFEMTSSIPNRRYANAFRRLGYGPQVTGFYDEHVSADAVHESVAAWDLADGLAQMEPELAPSILFGARALLALEARWAERLLRRWAEDRTSLLASPSAPPEPDGLLSVAGQTRG
jgi:hypothetical protein